MKILNPNKSEWNEMIQNPFLWSRNLPSNLICFVQKFKSQLLETVFLRLKICKRANSDLVMKKTSGSEKNFDRRFCNISSWEDTHTADTHRSCSRSACVFRGSLYQSACKQRDKPGSWHQLQRSVSEQRSTLMKPLMDRTITLAS